MLSVEGMAIRPLKMETSIEVMTTTIGILLKRIRENVIFAPGLQLSQLENGLLLITKSWHWT
jgi:hypothetical protein